MISQRLAELLDVDRLEVCLDADDPISHTDRVLRAGSLVFVVEWKGSGRSAAISAAMEQVRNRAKGIDGVVVPLVAVPFMGEVGRRRCADAGVSWMDLSGNSRIFAPGLRVLIEGKPNRYKQRGRPSTVFAPKSSRIPRWLLMHATQPLSRREIARATGMDEGYTSRIVSRLEDDGLVVGDDNGTIRPRDPDLLLDAWREAYDFSKHHLIRGHVAARAGDALLRQLADVLNHGPVSYAATGLAAAWLLDHFVGFRLATLYLAEEPSTELLSALSFRSEARGANVWLVIPNDEGVFHGATKLGGIRCVHPVQAYLDLGAHTERAEEAAQKLRSEHLRWKTDG
ncbi:MAG: type IV toxin-antitoxin system AbiEi family antitoxin [Desulfomonilaceae bacterium]|nr:type IV toxin-antitoxin system AbiEi family antitoxin [Desulfomonilaceae bacterium]